MAHLSITFCKQLADARREKGMTQSALAEAAGCKQSAISMLEAGHSAKIAQETVGKIAALLDVPMPGPHSPQGPLPAAHCPPPAAPHAFCPNALCPSNVPCTAGGGLLFWPRPQPDGAATHCVFCGELLERRCPHCGAAPGSPGACCPACGGAKVTDTLPPETDREAWAARRRRDIAEWLGLLR